jgi:hypothetical protein
MNEVYAARPRGLASEIPSSSGTPSPPPAPSTASAGCPRERASAKAAKVMATIAPKAAVYGTSAYR